MSLWKIFPIWVTASTFFVDWYYLERYEKDKPTLSDVNIWKWKTLKNDVSPWSQGKLQTVASNSFKREWESCEILSLLCWAWQCPNSEGCSSWHQWCCWQMWLLTLCIIKYVHIFSIKQINVFQMTSESLIFLEKQSIQQENLWWVLRLWSSLV